jgi:hypothetical protein
MIELEVYARGIRDLSKSLALDHQLEAVPDLRYKVDSNHDIVYMEFARPTLNIQQIRKLFRDLGLEPKFVGAVPGELRLKNNTERISLSSAS